jgi:hypothetical protein
MHARSPMLSVHELTQTWDSQQIARTRTQPRPSEQRKQIRDDALRIRTYALLLSPAARYAFTWRNGTKRTCALPPIDTVDDATVALGDETRKETLN